MFRRLTQCSLAFGAVVSLLWVASHFVSLSLWHKDEYVGTKDKAVLGSEVSTYAVSRGVLYALLEGQGRLYEQGEVISQIVKRRGPWKFGLADSNNWWREHTVLGYSWDEYVWSSKMSVMLDRKRSIPIWPIAFLLAGPWLTGRYRRWRLKIHERRKGQICLETAEGDGDS